MNPSRWIAWGSALLAAVAAAGCGRSESSAKPGQVGGELAVLTVSDLGGAWASECRPEAPQRSRLEFTQFDGDRARFQSRVSYGSLSCDGPDAELMETVYAYRLGDRESARPGARRIEMERVARFLMLTGSRVELANAARRCGIADWRAGERRDVGGAGACPELDSAPSPLFRTIFMEEGRLYVEAALPAPDGTLIRERGPGLRKLAR